MSIIDRTEQLTLLSSFSGQGSFGDHLIKMHRKLGQVLEHNCVINWLLIIQIISHYLPDLRGGAHEWFINMFLKGNSCEHASESGLGVCDRLYLLFWHEPGHNLEEEIPSRLQMEHRPRWCLCLLALLYTRWRAPHPPNECEISLSPSANAEEMSAAIFTHIRCWAETSLVS